MNKYLYFLIPFLLFFEVSFAQHTFQKAYGGPSDDHGQALLKTPDGGYAMTGSTIVGGSMDVYLVKLDSGGVIQWTRTYGGSSLEEGFGINICNDGGYIITGYSQSDTDAVTKAILIKTDVSGAIEWSRAYGLNYEIGQSVAQT